MHQRLRFLLEVGGKGRFIYSVVVSLAFCVLLAGLGISKEVTRDSYHERSFAAPLPLPAPEYIAEKYPLILFQRYVVCMVRNKSIVHRLVSGGMTRIKPSTDNKIRKRMGLRSCQPAGSCMGHNHG